MLSKIANLSVGVVSVLAMLPIAGAPNGLVNSEIGAPSLRATGLLDVACVPSAVTRGEYVSCTAKDIDGRAISVHWSFISSEPTLPYAVSDSVSAERWSGPMALSGCVTASTNDARSGSAVIIVEPRSWASAEIRMEVVDRGQGPYGKDMNFRLLDPPKDFSELGDTKSSITSAKNLGDFFERIAAGPNAGLYYAIAIPLKVKIDVAINRPAMTAGGVWWAMQPAKRRASSDSPYAAMSCSQEDVVDLLTPVEQHEGARQYPYSHVSTLKAPYERFITTGVERMVLAKLPTLSDFVPLASIAEEEAPIVSASITHDPKYNPIRQPPCEFKF
ncbi:MAG: hypothetical protein ABI969_01975 [bacterium]